VGILIKKIRILYKKDKKCQHTAGNLVVLRREINSQTNEKMMERFREIADP